MGVERTIWQWMTAAAYSPIRSISCINMGCMCAFWPSQSSHSPKTCWKMSIYYTLYGLKWITEGETNFRLGDLGFDSLSSIYMWISCKTWTFGSIGDLKSPLGVNVKVNDACVYFLMGLSSIYSQALDTIANKADTMMDGWFDSRIPGQSAAWGGK